jgi:hypothetical protein
MPVIPSAGSRVDRANRVNLRTVVVLTVSLLIGCSSVPIPPTYSQDELRVRCERQRGWWHSNGARGGYCEYRL